MNILELAQELNLSPKRVASTGGGEYHSACPKCGGRDRFIIWEKTGRYLCRQCNSKGDEIQFCRDFLSLDFKSACSKLGIIKERRSSSRFVVCPRFVATQAALPSNSWIEKAAMFITHCQKNLLNSSYAIGLFHARGLSLETIKTFSLGWNPDNKFLEYPEWGLPISHNQEGTQRKLWLPKGLVIPSSFNDRFIKLKIRRSAWEEGDKYPKYVEMSGSMKTLSTFGNKDLKIIVLVEAELDAMLIQQFASDLCCSMALGGVGKKPDAVADKLLNRADLILFALDFDEAGKRAFQFWRSSYSQVTPWPVPREKSPGDAFLQGVNLKSWIESGIRECNYIKPIS